MFAYTVDVRNCVFTFSVIPWKCPTCPKCQHLCVEAVTWLCCDQFVTTYANVKKKKKRAQLSCWNIAITQTGSREEIQSIQPTTSPHLICKMHSIFSQSAIFMLMTSLRYNKSVYMDFRLTAWFHTTLCWSSDKLWVLCCAAVIDFVFCTWWFSGPFRGKLAQKGHTPFKIYRIQTCQPARKQTNARSKKGWKSSDFECLLLSGNPGISLGCFFRAYLLS